MAFTLESCFSVLPNCFKSFAVGGGGDDDDDDADPGDCVTRVHCSAIVPVPL